MRIPINLLSLYDYHHVAQEYYYDKFGDYEIKTDVLYLVEPSLEHDIVTKLKFEHATTFYDWLIKKRDLCSEFKVMKTTLYPVVAAFFYEFHKDIEDIDEIDNWRYEFPVVDGLGDKVIEKVLPFIEAPEIRRKLFTGIEQKMNRHISKVGLIVEPILEKETKDAVIRESHRELLPPRRNTSLLSDWVAGTGRGIHDYELFLIAKLPDDIDDNVCMRENNDLHNLIVSAGYIVGPTANVYDACYVGIQWNFSGYFSDDKPYKRGDAVFAENTSLTDVYLCLKDMECCDDIRGSQYWIEIPQEIAIIYENQVRETMLLEHFDYALENVEFIFGGLMSR